MNTSSILYPLVAHVLWSSVLYALLTLARAPAIWGLGQRNRLLLGLQGIEPRLSANLSNQFEWPVLFYAAGAMQMAIGPPAPTGFVVIAWVFIAGRVLHSGVQIFTRNIRLRGLVFCVNFLAVLGMWGAACSWLRMQNSQYAGRY